jgi:Fe-S cluster biogenesis protein NfuA/nitrite reductase/ring-hydroxylating ferredoxin subunit
MTIAAPRRPPGAAGGYGGPVMAAAEPAHPELAAPPELAELAGEIARLEGIVAGWDAREQGVVAAYRRALEALHAEALRRLVRACRSEPAALAALRAAVADEVVYAVMRRLGIVKPSLDERVTRALDGVRPMLADHGGDVELVRVVPPRVEVRLLGACDGCASSAMTLHAAVTQAIVAACPEITDVVQVKGSGGDPGEDVSPPALIQLGAWRYACELAELADGGIRALAIGGREVLLARHAGAITCYDNACAHLGTRLDHGRIEAGVLTCRSHGFQYALSTGECLTVPTVALAKHLTRVVGTHVELQLLR